MSWLRIDDGFEDHAKVEPLSDAAHRLWTRAACWCQKPDNAHGRGFVPRSLLPTIAKRCAAPKRLEKLAHELVEAKAGGLFKVGLWEPVQDDSGKLLGWQFHDWDKYQPPPEEPGDLRRKRAEAGRKGAAARWQKDGLPSQVPSGLPPPLPSQTDSKPIAKNAPDPVPDPGSSLTRTAAAKDLTGQGPPEPPRRSQQQIPCPKNLWDLIPADSKANLTMGAGIPDWGQKAICQRFVMANEVSDGTDDRTETQWIRSVLKAIAGDWSNPKKRPPHPDSEQAAALARDSKEAGIPMTPKRATALANLERWKAGQ